jgi:STE24 endopeptidase
MPITFVVLRIIEWGGEYFYFYCFIIVVTFMLIMMFIYPNFIMPWFNKFTELNEKEHGELKNRVENLAKKLKFPLKKVLIMD